jgi:hypothetical protein
MDEVEKVDPLPVAWQTQKIKEIKTEHNTKHERSARRPTARLTREAMPPLSYNPLAVIVKRYLNVNLR